MGKLIFVRMKITEMAVHYISDLLGLVIGIKWIELIISCLFSASISAIVSFFISRHYYKKQCKDAAITTIIEPIKQITKEAISEENYKELGKYRYLYMGSYLSKEEKRFLDRYILAYEKMLKYKESKIKMEAVTSYLKHKLEDNNIDYEIFAYKFSLGEGVFTEESAFPLEVEEEIALIIDKAEYGDDNRDEVLADGLSRIVHSYFKSDEVDFKDFNIDNIVIEYEYKNGWTNAKEEYNKAKKIIESIEK